MRIKKAIFLVSVIALFPASCKKEDALGNVDNIPGLGGDTWVKTAIDQWLLDTLTVPFNIGVKYKWDFGEVQDDFNKTLVPPRKKR